MFDDFPPTAKIEMLQRRAIVLKLVRGFFEEHGYWEVETPLMSQETVVDANLDPFVVEGRYFLQTSPELAMKRLLAAGADAIYQITRGFRRGEQGRLHNPEFTMLEWYRTGDTHHAQMDVVEQLIRETTAKSPFAAELHTDEIPFRRRTYEDLFHDVLGKRVLEKDCRQLRQLAQKHQLVAPESLSPDDRDGWLNLLLAELVEPGLGREQPEFVYDYPASQGALAKIDPRNLLVAQRFELYIDGLEICNGYHELTDADELRRRIVVESRKRRAAGLAPLPEPGRLLQAMDAGLPPCSGVALGFDRLLMVLAGAESIAEVMAFPLDRA